MLTAPPSAVDHGHFAQQKLGAWQRAGWLAVAGVVGAYLAFIVPFFCNIPQGDDLISILPFVEHWRGASAADRLSELFAQHFSHRIVLTRLAALAVYSVKGHLDLVVLQCLGLVLWLGFALSLTWQCARRADNVWYALPITLLLLNPKGVTNILIAMQAVQNIGILVLAALAIATVCRSSSVSFAISLLLCVVAIFTSANGLVLAPVLVVFLAFRKQYYKAAVCLAVGVAATAFYFHGFAQAKAGSFSLHEFVANFVVMVGGPFRLDRFSASTCGIFGALLVIITLVLIIQHRKSPPAEPVVMFICFLLGSVALAAYGRLGWGSDYMMQDRYSPYGLLLAAGAWMLAANPDRRPSTYLPALALAGVVSVCTFASSYPQLVESDRMAQAIILNQNFTENFSHDEWGSHGESQRQAIAADVLRLPPPSAAAPSFSAVQALAKEAATMRPTQNFELRRDVTRAAYALSPSVGSSPVATEFCLLLTPAGPFVLPGACTRESYLGMIRHLDLLRRDLAVYLWPTSKPSSDPMAIAGIHRTNDNRWSVAWRGTVTGSSSAASP